MKLERQYLLELSPPQPDRHNFITRRGSWHGFTIAALAMGDFKARKHIFEPILPTNVNQVSACNIYRGLKNGETETVRNM
jgi:adenosylmethionine-8-amino-7-oxononanoate aminotransferase